MSRRKFDRFMVAVDVGTNRKLRRLPVAQRWVYVAGVLSLAAQAPRRGALLIAAGEPATDEDVAMQATVTVKEARAALASLRKLKMLERDDDGVEWVHDFDDVNPAPRSDSTNAERQARFRARNGGGNGPSNGSGNGRNAVTNAPVTQGKVEGEVEVPPLPPAGGRSRSRQTFEAEMTDWAGRHFPDAHADEVQALAGWMRSRDLIVTADSMRSYAEENPKWEGILGPALSDEQRAQIAELGAKVVDINRRAEA